MQILKRAKAILCGEIHLCRLKYATAALKARSKRLKLKIPLPVSSLGGNSGSAIDSTDISEEEGVKDSLDTAEATVMAAFSDLHASVPATARLQAKADSFIETSFVDYATGFVTLSREMVQGADAHKSDRAKGRVHKRKLLFGSDLILL